MQATTNTTTTTTTATITINNINTPGIPTICKENVCAMCEQPAIPIEKWIEANPKYSGSYGMSDESLYGRKVRNGRHRGPTYLSEKGQKAFNKKGTRIMTFLRACCNHPICNRCMSAVIHEDYDKGIQRHHFKFCPFCKESWLDEDGMEIWTDAPDLFLCDVDDFEYYCPTENHPTCTGCKFCLRYANRCYALKAKAKM